MTGLILSIIFEKKFFCYICSINWPNLIVWFPLLCELLGNMCNMEYGQYGIVCKSGCDIMNFKVNLIFLIQLFCHGKSLCLLFFINFFVFHLMIALQKLWQMFFISLQKLFLFLRYSVFCIFSSSFPHFPDWKGQIKLEWLMMSCIGLYKFAGVIFGITKKLLYITPSNLIR